MHLAPVTWATLLPIVQAAQAPTRGEVGIASRKERHASRDTAGGVTTPKLFIINMYEGEGDTWLSNKSLALTANNITIPGLSPLFPDAHCTAAGDVCEITTGEGEINAATSMMALTLSSRFDLAETYFMISGIAGVSPLCGTIGSVAFSRFAVQVALQYEIDPRELPSNFSTGYIPQGSTSPNEYPQTLYGTEVFEPTLEDNKSTKRYRAKYHSTEPGSELPTVFAGDTATADNFFSGQRLGDAFANYATLVTNGTAKYCMSQQEDNASLEALLRADLAGRVDFSRVLIMRAGSDFDRPPPHVSPQQNLFVGDSTGLPLALNNMFLAGIEIVNDIRANWASVYQKGIQPQNYVGDIFDSLHGPIPPDFGLPADYGNGSLTGG